MRRMPPGPARMHVYGRCSRSDARLALKRHEPQGINPYELILELVQEGDKRLSHEASYRLVEFREPFQGMECGYRTMLILPDRIQLAVQDAF
jgi:hypothetical protein